MDRELLDKQISVEKLMELLVLALHDTLRTLTELGKKKSKKLYPTASAGMVVAGLLRVLLTEFDMYTFERVAEMADDILTKATEMVPEE